MAPWSPRPAITLARRDTPGSGCGQHPRAGGWAQACAASKRELNLEHSDLVFGVLDLAPSQRCQTDLVYQDDPLDRPESGYGVWLHSPPPSTFRVRPTPACKVHPNIGFQASPSTGARASKQPQADHHERAFAHLHSDTSLRRASVLRISVRRSPGHRTRRDGIGTPRSERHHAHGPVRPRHR